MQGESVSGERDGVSGRGSLGYVAVRLRWESQCPCHGIWSQKDLSSNSSLAAFFLCVSTQSILLSEPKPALLWRPKITVSNDCHEDQINSWMWCPWYGVWHAFQAQQMWILLSPFNSWGAHGPNKGEKQTHKREIRACIKYWESGYRTFKMVN